MIPDKHTYKPTITQTLRNQIISLTNSFLCRPDWQACQMSNTSYFLESTCANLSFLEIGCDIGYTTEFVAQYFKQIYALDIDQNKITIAKQRIKHNNVDFIVGTSNDLQKQNYDVVLIDAAHDMKNVITDFENVCKNNLSTKFIMFFHDFGLDVKHEVKEAVQFLAGKYQLFYKVCGEQDNWNPKGLSTNDYEAAYMLIQHKINVF